jgi:hypothetical protein
VFSGTFSRLQTTISMPNYSGTRLNVREHFPSISMTLVSDDPRAHLNGTLLL